MLKGLSLGVVSVAALAALQLYDFGLQHNWVFSWAWPPVTGIDWVSQWYKIAIIVTQSAAAVAAITIGLSVVVNNIFTTNISNQIVSNVTEAINERYVNALDELKRTVDEFADQLRQNRVVDQAELERLLETMANKLNAELRDRLRKDDELLNRVVNSLSAAVTDVEASHPKSGKAA